MNAILNSSILLPAFFILITIVTVGIYLYAVSNTGRNNRRNVIISTIFLFAWGLLQGVLTYNDFYLNTQSMPPRMIFGLLPMFVLIGWMLTGSRKNFSLSLSLKTLTLLHLIRIPVEFILLGLYYQGLIPQIMTFEGRNLDILSGISALIVYYFGFHQKRINVRLILIWNIVSLGLLLNILIIAILSFPYPMQQFGLDQPNTAILTFPYIWLATIVVPIVFFSHLVSIIKIISIRFRRPGQVVTNAKSDYVNMPVAKS
jgi:hypothetical protein